jgi:transcriptional regulator with XRE-family HTH domain
MTLWSKGVNRLDEDFCLAHGVRSYPQTVGMKKAAAQIFRENLERLMAANGLHDNNYATGQRLGIAHSYIKKLREGESEPSTATFDKVAKGFGVLPFELLLDGEEARVMVLAKLASTAITDEHVERHLPRAPAKGVAHQRKKAGGNDDGRTH